MTVGRLLALALVVCGSSAWPDETSEEIRFAPPQRIEAGDAVVGAGRYYPSPVLHDVDGDGVLDIVVGDLFGGVTVARRTKEGVLPEAQLEGRDGEPLKFHNW